MPLLKEIAAGLGFDDPQTYLQSGNLAVTTTKSATSIVRALEKAIADETGLSVPVVVRSHDELIATVEANPLDAPTGDDQKLLFVTFCPEPVGDLGVDPDAYGDERAAHVGREIYAWHPTGMHASKLASALARKGAKSGTARNWRTVLALVDLTA